MSALSALGGSSRANLIPGAGDGTSQEGSTGKDFASMMNTDPAAASAPRPRPNNDQASQEKSATRPDRPDETRASDNQEGKDNASEKTGGTEQRHSAGTDQRERSSSDAAKDAAKASDPRPGETKTAEQAEPHDDTWPPAGLAGFGMAVLPVLNTVLPGAVATPLAAGSLAINLAAGAAKGIAGLLGGDAAPASAATDPAAAAATSGGSAALANGAFTGLLAQAAAASKTAGSETAPMAALAALAALAGTGDKNADDASTTGADPISLLASVAPAPTSRAIDSSTPFSASPTPTPDLHGDFDDALGARMSWLADQKIGHAHIKISPADLGPIEVRLHLNGDQVNASFTSAQAEVRHALENSLPRLRDMLGQHGFQLGQADVGQQQQQTSQGGQPFSGGDGGNPANDELLGTAGIPAVVMQRRGLLDAYA